MRKFKCIGLEESEAVCWSQNFTIGVIYEEQNQFPVHLHLTSDSGANYFVDPDQFEEVISPWKSYRRTGHSEMRPYVVGEDMTEVSVSPEDFPELDMGMIARNPKNHKDQWYVAKDYFEENLEEIV